MDLMHMWNEMGYVAKAIAVILVIMSMISFGVAIERIYTFTQARKQSKLYAPQVAKHLKEGRLKDAIAISSSKNYRYSHLAKVVLAGLQEYQFQQEAGGDLSREDLVDTVRRAIQRASALTANDLKKGVSVARDHRRHRAVRRTARHGRRHHHRVPGHRGHRLGRSRRGLGRYLGSARRNGARPGRGHPGGVVLQLPHRPDRVLQRRDGQLVVRARRLLHQEDRVISVPSGCRRRAFGHTLNGPPAGHRGAGNTRPCV